MTLPEHLDPETTAPDLPDGYDRDGGWTAQEWWDALGDDHEHQADSSRTCWCGIHIDALDIQRPADFDDEERRP